MPASFSRATIHGGVGRVGSTSRTMRVANTAEPTRPRMGACVADLDREAVARGIHRRRLLDRVAEPRAGRVRVLAGDAADRERVAAVGRDVDLDGGVVEAEQRDRVGCRRARRCRASRGAGCRRGRRRGRARAPRRSCRRRRARRSCGPRSGTGRAAPRPGSVTTTLSPTKKLRAPQTMPCTASPPSAAVSPSGATRTWHQRMVLPLDCGSSTNSSTSPTTIGPCELERVHVLLFEADPHEGGVHVFRRRARHELDVLGEPAERHSHGSDHHSELLGEADVSLDHVAHVLHVVAEHEPALDAHAEGEPV